MIAGDTKVVEHGRRRRHVHLHDRHRARRPARGARHRRRCGPATGCWCPGRWARTAWRSCSPAASSSCRRRSSPTPRRCGRRRTRCWTRPGADAALHARRHARRRRLGAERARARLGGRRCSSASRTYRSKPAVAAAAELLGIDPLYVANEGRLVAFVAPGVGGGGARSAARGARAASRRPRSARSLEEPPGMVLVDTAFGGQPRDGPAGGRPAAEDLLMHELALARAILDSGRRPRRRAAGADASR